MRREITEHIYEIKDIYKAFNMGVETAMSVFEETIGMSPDNQRYILSRIKDRLIEDRAALAMSNSYLKT